MKFTIVIPCYKCEKWLKACLDSVKRQPGSWECILRLESSPDRTAEILRNETAGDSRFVILEGDSPSGSPSLSRNIGIEHATGDYVLFLDSDDELAPDTLAQLEPFLQERPDVATMAINWDGNIRDNWAGIDGIISGKDATIRLAEKQAFPLAAAVQYLCRTDFLRAKGLRFVSGLRHEDEEFYPRLLYLADSVLPTHLPLYLYQTREASMTTASRERSLLAIAEVMRSHLSFWCETKPAEAVSRAWTRTWLSMFFFVFFHPKSAAGVPAGKTREALRVLMADGGAKDFREFAKFASPPKRLGAMLTRFSAATGILWPTKAYFALYYRLCKTNE